MKEFGEVQPDTSGHSNAIPIARPVFHPESRNDRHIWYEVGAVLALAVLPYLLFSVYHILFPTDSGSSSAIADSWFLATGNIQVAIPLMYILWNSKEPLRHFGFRWPRWRRDIPLALLIIVITNLCYNGFVMLVMAITGADRVPHRWSFAEAQEWRDFAAIVICSCTNGFTEELVMRGYLITRIERLMKSTGFALFASTFLFSMYHAYQGAVSVVSALIFGMLAGIVFVRTRRLWPVVLAHIVADIYPFVMNAILRS